MWNSIDVSSLFLPLRGCNELLILLVLCKCTILCLCNCATLHNYLHSKCNIIPYICSHKVLGTDYLRKYTCKYLFYEITCFSSGLVAVSGLIECALSGAYRQQELWIVHVCCGLFVQIHNWRDIIIIIIIIISSSSSSSSSCIADWNFLNWNFNSLGPR